MAIVAQNLVEAHSGTTFTGADATSVQTMCGAVDAALKRLVWPFQPEPVTVTNQLLDAPMNNVLQLPLLPVRSITNLYLHWGASGDPTQFDTTNDLLANYTDYYMPIDDSVNTWSRTGRVFRRGASVWGYEMVRRLGRLYVEADVNRGAVMASYAAGCLSVPADLQAAAVTAVLLLFQRRKLGAPVQSESWNGYSYGLSGPFTAEAAVRSPEVLALLAPYLTVGVA